jgi:hypothetical protein
MAYTLVVNVPGALVGDMEVVDVTNPEGPPVKITSSFSVPGLGTFENGGTFELTDEQVQNYEAYTGNDIAGVGEIHGFTLTAKGSSTPPPPAPVVPPVPDPLPEGDDK